jgi:hypothetical protein
MTEGHQRTLPELIKTVKALDSKLAHSEGKSADLKTSLGLTLAEAKERLQESNKAAGKGKAITWPDFLEKHFSFGRSRANELIQIGQGRKTDEEVRERVEIGNQKRRANKSKPPILIGGSNKPEAGAGSSIVADNKEAPKSITDRVGYFHTELMTFTDEYCGRLQAWFEDHAEIDDECKTSLMQALELCAGRFQRLAQSIDGR